MTAPPLFSEPFWLDAVAPGRWDAVEIGENGRTIARLPFVRGRSRLAGTILTMPPLTPYLGPWIAPLPGKPATRLSREHELTDRLIAGLPRFGEFSQNFHPSVTNWLPFCWRGFEQTTRYTFVLPDLDDPDTIWDGFRESVRRQVRKASRKLAVRDDLGLDALLELGALTFRRQRMPVPFRRETVERVDGACAARGCRRILIAEDAAGRRHAGVYLVWDGSMATYLLGGGDPGLRSSGAGSLLLWEAIRHASQVTESFDFEGSMVPAIERHFRAFGGRQTPYHQVVRVDSHLLRAKRALKSVFRR